jgi:hypothetical protein
MANKDRYNGDFAGGGTGDNYHVLRLLRGALEKRDNGFEELFEGPSFDRDVC